MKTKTKPKQELEHKPKTIGQPKSRLEELATPIEVKTTDDLLLFKCPGCKNVHFRHAGYLEIQVPFVKADFTEKLASEPMAVRVCTTCKRCLIFMNSKCYDVTKLIDLEAWDKTEKEMQKATGPGGNC